MTMPIYMNCQHSGTGWCLDCVKTLGEELSEVKQNSMDLGEVQGLLHGLKCELRRCVTLLDGDCTMPDGSNADTQNAHALLGDWDEVKIVTCTACDGRGEDCTHCCNGSVTKPEADEMHHNMMNKARISQSLPPEYINSLLEASRRLESTK